jgi:hypothetical protein
MIIRISQSCCSFDFQTAFFEVTKDMAHGADLICSHDVCRNGGIKFLYCAFCRGPAARRNFRTSHSHPGEAKHFRNVSACNDAVEIANAPKKRADKEDATGPPRKRVRSAAAAATSQHKPPSAHMPQLPSLLVDLAVARLNAENNESSKYNDVDEEEKLNPRQNNTANDAALGCLDKIAASDTQSEPEGSDSDAVLGENNRLAAANEACEQLRIRKEWLQLLAERRRLITTNDMTAWLMRVLATSDPTRRPPEAISDETEVSSDLTSSADHDARPEANNQEKTKSGEGGVGKASDDSKSTKTDNDLMDSDPMNNV